MGIRTISLKLENKLYNWKQIVRSSTIEQKTKT